MSLLAAGAVLAGSILTNRSNRSEAQRNRNFQARQSSSAYQRSMADMRAAGLNPMLAYSQGGASTPSGSMSKSTNPAEPAVASAVQTARVDAELENMKQTNRSLRSKANMDATLEDMYVDPNFRALKELGPAGATAYGISRNQDAITSPFRSMFKVDKPPSPSRKAWQKAREAKKVPIFKKPTQNPISNWMKNKRSRYQRENR